MAKAQVAIALDAVDQGDGQAEQAEGAASYRKVPKELRPLFVEISRLSGTLAMARNACYAGEPDKARDALRLLGRRVPDAVETAEILVPSDSE